MNATIQYNTQIKGKINSFQPNILCDYTICKEKVIGNISHLNLKFNFVFVFIV